MDEEKIVSIEDRIPKLKQSRKKKANRRLLFYLSIFFLLIAIIVYLQSPLSQIQTTIVNGNQVLTDNEVIEKSGLSKGDNIWMMNQTQAANHITEHPIVNEATVTRKLPQAVELEVDEHRVVGYIETDENQEALLANGTMLTSEKAINQGEGPLLHDFKKNDYLERLAGELQDIPEDIFNLISEITWEPTDKNKYRIRLYMNDGFVVQTTIRNFATKMASYPSIVSQLDDDEKGIVHMGVGTYYETFTE